MRKSTFGKTQIVSILKQVNAGVTVKDLCRRAGISTATDYRWKSKSTPTDIAPTTSSAACSPEDFRHHQNARSATFKLSA